MKKSFKCLFASFLSCLTVGCISPFSASAAADGSPYESYSYDRWGEAIPSQAGYKAERTVSGYDLGIGAMESPSDIYYAYDDTFYIADSGNDRIIVTDGEMSETVKVMDRFTMPDGSITTLKKPTGIFVSEYNGLIYIADNENSRVLISDMSGNVTGEITKPDSEVYDQAKTFDPQRVISDKAGNVYVVLSNITTGAAMFDPEGEFTGFYGANRVQPTAEIVREYFSRIFMSDEKRSRRAKFVPTGITSFDMDGDFIFTCSSSSTQTTDTVKKLNAAGKNIFSDLELKFGDYSPMYDTSQNKLREPSIVDIDIAADGNINCLDNETGRIFQYDEDCNLLFITGTKAKQVGGFEQAAALESRGNRLYVVDSMKDTVTIFKETEFGAIVHKASALHNEGFYEEALGPWREVLKRDGSYRRAYLGVAAALLRQGDYRGAMKYAKLADAGYIYNKAFEGYRLELIKENFGLIVFAIIALAAVILAMSRKRKKKAAAQESWKKLEIPENTPDTPNETEGKEVEEP